MSPPSQHQEAEHRQRSTGDGPRERVLAGIPATERRLGLAGVSTAVLEGGEGPPVVLLHSSGEFAALWMRVIPAWWETTGWSLPTCPATAPRRPPTTRSEPHRVLAWLDELIGRTCPSPPTLVGRGLGGAIAARFAIGHGDRLGGLVLVDAFGLAPFEPAPSFALVLNRFLARPDERTRDGLFEQCFVDLDGLRRQVRER